MSGIDTKTLLKFLYGIIHSVLFFNTITFHRTWAVFEGKILAFRKVCLHLLSLEYGLVPIDGGIEMVFEICYFQIPFDQTGYHFLYILYKNWYFLNSQFTYFFFRKSNTFIPSQYFFFQIKKANKAMFSLRFCS